MGYTVDPSHGTGAYILSTNARKPKSIGTQASNFLEAVARADKCSVDPPAVSMDDFAKTAALPVQSVPDLSARSAGQVQADGVKAAKATSLEAMLKAKYPHLAYHVFDASSSFWRSRIDYADYLFYQAGEQT